MIRPTLASVDLSALRSNLQAIAGMLRRESAAAGRAEAPGIIAVVKANAYGHGAATAGPVVEQAGAAMLACADLEEGVSLRQAGVRAPILVFGALSVSDLEAVFDYALTPTVSTPGAARALSAKAAARGVTLACHLKIDTGMNRLGFRHDNLRRTMPAVLADPHLVVTAAYTHFATADEPASPFFEEQRVRFERATAALGALGLRGARRHAANSAALLRDTRTWYDWVRPGLLLYGIVPPPLSSALSLQPALSLTSRIVAVKGLRVGEGAGYGLRWRAEDGPRTIAIVPAGYADGLEAVGERTGFGELAAEPKTLWLEDYAVPWFGEGGGVWERAAVSVAGIIGTLAVVVISLVCDRLISRQLALRGDGLPPLSGNAS